MSVKIMALTWRARFHDAKVLCEVKKKNGETVQKEIRVLASNLKSICLSLADHSNDEGEGAYPSLSLLMAKTELSRPTVVAALKALKQEGAISFVGWSKWSTSNYTVHQGKLEEWASREGQIRLKASKAALPVLVKPLYSASKAALLEPSLNHQETYGDVVTKNETQPEPQKPERTRRTDATIKGDPMDGILAAAAEAEARSKAEGLEKEVLDRIIDFPQDCWPTLMWFAKRYSWAPPAIPAKPSSSRAKAGSYGQWINEVREINQLLAGTGKDGLDAAAKVSNSLTVSHPAAITWAINGVVGDVRKKKAAVAGQQQPLTPFQQARQAQRQKQDA